ncbi:MAG: hypothetical protein NVS3B28_12790 [Candidatus Velthaea sp.]
MTVIVVAAFTPPGGTFKFNTAFDDVVSVTVAADDGATDFDTLGAPAAGGLGAVGGVGDGLGAGALTEPPLGTGEPALDEPPPHAVRPATARNASDSDADCNIRNTRISLKTSMRTSKTCVAVARAGWNPPATTTSVTN